jgi:methylated-DNA-[protein]-cysteine S-methyltransferase
MFQAVLPSPLGPLTLFQEGNALISLVFGDYGGFDDTPLFRETARQLEEYFSGRRLSFSLPLDPGGTPFQRSVWRVLADLPWGKTTTYGALAKQLGIPGGARAVGQACGKNPLPVLIPCHRCLGKKNALGGYSGGPGRKAVLLDLEGIPYTP